MKNRVTAAIAAGLVFVPLVVSSQVGTFLETLRAASASALSAGTTVTSSVFSSHRGVTVFLDINTLTLPDADDEVDFYLQTSYDGGTTWCDLENLHFGNAANGTTAKRVLSVGAAEFGASDTAVTCTDGTLADGTKVKTPMGDRVRIKTAVSGATAPTYDFTATAAFR